MADGVFRQQTKLVWPFPDSVVHRNPAGGGTYVRHSTVVQRLLDVTGPPDTHLVEIVRGEAAGKKVGGKPGPALTDVVVAVVLRMEVVVDGRKVSVTESGDCELPSNWPHDGARIKDAFSDAYKRCAMRIGVGLHLWADADFYLADKLKKQDDEATK